MYARAADLRGSSLLDYVLWISKVEAIKHSKEKKEVHRKRLEERLQLFGMKERSVKGDGNCQFYALSDQLYGTQSKAAAMRKAVVTWLRPRGDWNPTKSAGAELKNFATRPWNEYCDDMAKDGTWGDHLTLVAIAEIFGVAIRIISSVPGDEFFTEIDPMENKDQRGRAKTVFLSHWWEYHYCSLTENDNMAFSISCLGQVNNGVGQTPLPDPESLVSAADIIAEALADAAATPALPATSAGPTTTATTTTSRSASVTAGKNQTAVVLKIHNKDTDDLRRISRAEWPAFADLDSLFHKIFCKQMPAKYTMRYRDEEGDMCSVTSDLEYQDALQHVTTIGERPILFLEFSAA